MVPDLAGGNPSSWLLNFTGFNLFSNDSICIMYLISHFDLTVLFVEVFFIFEDFILHNQILHRANPGINL